MSASDDIQRVPHADSDADLFRGASREARSAANRESGTADRALEMLAHELLRAKKRLHITLREIQDIYAEAGVHGASKRELNKEAEILDGYRAVGSDVEERPVAKKLMKLFDVGVSPDQVRARLERWSMYEPTSGCLIWLSQTSVGGYASAGFYKHSFPAHILSYEIAKGKIPDGFVIDHLCRVRCCINPDHLEAVTNKVNILRGAGATAINAAKTHCPSGHEYTESNTRTRRDGSRVCKACRREYTKLWSRVARSKTSEAAERAREQMRLRFGGASA